MSESTGDLLAAVSHRLRRGFAEALGADDITPGQVRALRIVDESGPLRLSGLAEHLHIAPRSATEVVDALEARGLVTRSPDPQDRRAVAVTTTAKGRQVRDRADRIRVEQAEGLLGRLPSADRAELDRLLRLLADD